MDKPKILLVSQWQPYPLHCGGALAQYYFIDGLKNEFKFVLCTIAHDLKEKETIERLQEKNPELRIYYVEQFRREKKNTWGKMKAALKSLHRGKTTTSVSAVDDFKDPYFAHVDHAFSQKFIDLINEIIIKEKITKVQFDFYDTIDICYALPKDVEKIFVHHEVRFKRLQLAAAESGCSDAYKNYLIGKTAAFERACLGEMDKVVVFNEDDAKELEPFCKKVIVSPFAIPDELIFDLKHDNVYSRLLFCGGEGHTPNALGLKWFLDEIYVPNHDKINLPLYITGVWSAAFKEQYKACDKVVFCGLVESLATYFEDSIFVNPILTGAGIRTKVLHAMANRVPVMSTRFGAEGCYSAEENSHIAFFDSAEEFLNCFNNCDFKSLAEKGCQYYNRAFNKEKLLGIRKKIIGQE